MPAPQASSSGRSPETMPPPVASASVRTRILIVGASASTVLGLRSALGSHNDIVVAAEARTIREAIPIAEDSRADTVLLDADHVTPEELAAASRAAAPAARLGFAVMCSAADDRVIVDWIRAGASGFVLKQAPLEEIIATIRGVASGQAPVGSAMARAVLNGVRSTKRYRTPRLASLTGKEERILELLAGGQTTRAIATELNLAQGTVRNRISLILSKLRVGSRAEGVAWFERERRAALPASVG